MEVTLILIAGLIIWFIANKIIFPKKEKNQSSNIDAQKICNHITNEYYNRSNEEREPLSILLDKYLKTHFNRSTEKESVRKEVYAILKQNFSDDTKKECISEKQEAIEDIKRFTATSLDKVFSFYSRIYVDKNFSLDMKLLKKATAHSNIENNYADWVRNTDIHDDEFKSVTWLLHKSGVLEKKKESNRVFWKYSGCDIKQELEYFLQEYTIDKLS